MSLDLNKPTTIQDKWRVAVISHDLEAVKVLLTFHESQEYLKYSINTEEKPILDIKNNPNERVAINRTQTDYKHKCHPITLCCIFGCSQILQLLLEANCQTKGPINSSSSLQPITIATKFNYLEVVQVLLNFKADPNEFNGASYSNIYETPLKCAVMNNNLEMIELLLSYGADPSLLIDNKEIKYYATTYETYKILSKKIRNFKRQARREEACEDLEIKLLTQEINSLTKRIGNLEINKNGEVNNLKNRIKNLESLISPGASSTASITATTPFVNSAELA